MPTALVYIVKDTDTNQYYECTMTPNNRVFESGAVVGWDCNNSAVTCCKPIKGSPWRLFEGLQHTISSCVSGLLCALGCVNASNLPKQMRERARERRREDNDRRFERKQRIRDDIRRNMRRL